MTPGPGGNGFFSYLAFGPPGPRLRQLLALSRVGVVRFVGADMAVRAEGGVFRASSATVPGVSVEARAPVGVRRLETVARAPRRDGVGAPRAARAHRHVLAGGPSGRSTSGHPRVAEGDGVVLTAAEADGLNRDGKPFDGVMRLAADQGPAGAARVAHGGRLVVLVGEGVWGVRDFGPDAEARRRFRGIAATPYDPHWSVPGRFTPYDEGRTVRVPNADGRERGLGLGGEVAFRLDGQEHTLRVSVQGGGSLWAVFADATSGDGSYRFRFLHPAAHDAEGRTTVDFDRAQLPTCAFADHLSAPSRRPATRCPSRSGQGRATWPEAGQGAQHGANAPRWFKS